MSEKWDSDRNRKLLMEIYIKQLSRQYRREKECLREIINALDPFLLENYKKIAPLDFFTQWSLKKFLRRLSGFELLPCEDEYIDCHVNNEFFDITIAAEIGNPHIDEGIRVQFPYPINIHKVTKLICDNNLSPTELSVLDLIQVINPECFGEFEDQMALKRTGEDPLDSMKAHNPIILLCSGGIIKQPYLINGTHRVIQAFKDGVLTLEGYLVDSNVCSMCGISNDYKLLCGMIEKLDRKFELHD